MHKKLKILGEIQHGVFALLALFACLAMLRPAGVAVRREERTRRSVEHRITPPRPVFDDKERVAELMQRRERVAKALARSRC